MDICELRERHSKAVKHMHYWSIEADRLKAEISKSEDELRPKVFEMILKKKIEEACNDICEISEKEYHEICSENDLSYVVFKYFVDFVAENAKANGWRIEFCNKTVSGTVWTNFYDIMDTYAIRIYTK